MSDTPSILIPAHHRADRSFIDYNELNLDAEMNVDEMSQADLEAAFAKRIGFKLMTTYPQRRWSVTVDIVAGYAQICCQSLSTTKGFILHLAKYHTMRDLMKRVAYAGGEILERYGISRGRKFDTDQIEALERDWNDEAISPDSEPNKRIIVP